MKKKIVFLLFLVGILLSVAAGAKASELPVLEEDNTADIQAKPEYQLVDLRYSLGLEKDRFVFDLNKPCAYEVKFNEARTEVSILLNATDQRKITKIKAKDKVVREIKVEPYSLDISKTMIRIFFNYQVPVSVSTLSEPDRLVVDVQKIFYEEKAENLGSGVEYKNIYAGTAYGPLHIELVQVTDLKKMIVLPGIARKDGRFSRSTVSSLAGQYKALVAINAGYFSSTGQPLGILVADNRLLTYPYAARTAFLIKNNGQMEINNVAYQEKIFLSNGQELKLDGLNKVRSADQIVLYDGQRGRPSTETNSFGLEVAVTNNKVTEIGEGNLTIPENGYVLSAHGQRKSELASLSLGDLVERERKFIPDWQSQNIKHILGGGPRLVKGGKRFITSEEEKFKADIARGRAPRSALGLTKEGNLLLVAISGRQPDYSVGVTLNELADYLISWGAVEGMNLDGGGSTAFWVKDKIVNQPSDGQERKVSNILLVKEK